MQYILNAIGSAALTKDRSADASQKKTARTPIVIDPKVRSKDQLRPSRRGKVCMSSAIWREVVSGCPPDKAGWNVLIVKIPCSRRTTRRAAFGRKIGWVADKV